MSIQNNTQVYGWKALGESHPSLSKKISTKVIDLININSIDIKNNMIIDIGSGNGYLCRRLKDEIANSTVVGIEYDKEGHQISSNAYNDITFYNQGVEDGGNQILNDFNGELFDFVISTEVIEHLYSPHLLPQLASTLLKENGVLIISTPYHGYIKNLALSLLNKWDEHHTVLREGGHIKFWSKETLCKLLKENGFQIIDFHGIGRMPYMWMSMIILAKKIKQ